MRVQPLPGSGLTLLNLREVLEKCRSENELEAEKSTCAIYLAMNGNIIL